MHEGYARPPCGVTLTGFRSRARSTRAFYPRRTELEGVSCAPGAAAAQKVKSAKDAEAAGSYA